MGGQVLKRVLFEWFKAR